MTSTAVATLTRTDTAEFRLHKEVEAAKVLREQIADLAAGDPEFIRDTIEGETGLHEAIGRVVASLQEDGALASGIGKLIDDLSSRKARIEDRADNKRALIAAALETAECRKLETPAGTVSVRPLPAKLIVVEEADIPAKFWKTAAPTLDRKAVLDALKDRNEAITGAHALDDPAERTAALEKAQEEFPVIPGAVLSNGSRTINIRVK